MNHAESTDTDFSTYLARAVLSLRTGEPDLAYTFILDAMRLDPDAAAPHNLLGIYYELRGNGDKARRHYRAAYSLDPTYRPACRNLEQITLIYAQTLPYVYDYGDTPTDEVAEKRKRGYERN